MTTHQKRTRHGVVTADQADHERRYVAAKRLRWGDGWIEVGEEVPSERALGTMTRSFGAATCGSRASDRSDEHGCRGEGSRVARRHRMLVAGS